MFCQTTLHRVLISNRHWYRNKCLLPSIKNQSGQVQSFHIRLETCHNRQTQIQTDDDGLMKSISFFSIYIQPTLAPTHIISASCSGSTDPWFCSSTTTRPTSRELSITLWQLVFLQKLMSQTQNARDSGCGYHLRPAYERHDNNQNWQRRGAIICKTSTQVADEDSITITKKVNKQRPQLLAVDRSIDE